ncbi:MAG: AMP-binding protein [Halioglobus sp.]|nr:AMP-binding protein [Halioglobus sp.]
MNLANSLIQSANSWPDKVAIYHGDTPYLSWRDLEYRAAKVAAAMQALGVTQGDCVGLAMTNCPQFVEILYACWRLGAIAVPMNAKGHALDFQYMLEHSGAPLCFVTPDLEPTLGKAIVDMRSTVKLLPVNSAILAGLIQDADEKSLPTIPQDDALPAWLFYTSGTTGLPKGATLSHRNLLAMAASYFSDVDDVEPQDNLVHAAPMSHGSGLYIIPHVMKGASQVVPVSGKFKEDELPGLIDHFQHCTIFAAPTMLQRLLANPEIGGLPGLKTLVLGGGPLYVRDCISALEKFGPKLAQIYGQGETPMTITAMNKQQMYEAYENNDLDFLGSVGRPFSTVDVAVVDTDGNTLQPGEMGEIVVRGDTVMSGYWNNESATAEAVRNGWLYTGDVGCFDTDNVLTLKDRSKDLIISGGTNIYPREVEEVLIQHPAVKEACVLGLPDELWGESVVAALVPQPGSEIDTADIDRFCIENLARFKRPKYYLVVDDLPKTATGKVLKSNVQALLPEKPAGA